MEELKKEILNKKIDNYYFNDNNYATIDELTVTITLNEYRNLIEELATKKHDISKANEDKYSREKENSDLKQKVKDLETLLLKYKCAYGVLKEEIEGDEE